MGHAAPGQGRPRAANNRKRQRDQTTVINPIRRCMLKLILLQAPLAPIR